MDTGVCEVTPAAAAAVLVPGCAASLAVLLDIEVHDDSNASCR